MGSSTSSTAGKRKRSGSKAKRRSRGLYVIAWIETHCVHTKGKWAGSPGARIPFRLLAWQKRFIMLLFEVEWNEPLSRYTRIVLRALLGVAKKNGKTELAAALACYFAMGDDEPNPLVLCAAASDDQADLVFGAAAFMCRESPTLSLIAEVGESSIVIPSNDGEIRRIAATGGLQDGVNASVVICDELHEWIKPRHEDTYRVITKSGGSRDEPLILHITTAGSDLESICGQLFDYGERVNAGELEDKSILHVWYALPEDADHRDESLWPQANPSLGETVNVAYLRSHLTDPENEWRRYFGNQWVASLRGLFHDQDLDPLVIPGLELDRRLPLFVGIDVGIYHDSSAVTAAQWNPRLPAHPDGPRDDDGELVPGRVAFEVWTWENPYPEKHTLHDSWKLEIDAVLNLLRELARDFPLSAAEVDGRPAPGPAFLFDPQFVEYPAQLLAGEGLNMVKFRQDDHRMIPASMTFYKMIRDRIPAHAGTSPAFKRQMKNAISEAKPYDRWRISKPKGSRRKIDAAISSAIGCSEAYRPVTPARKSVYEKRGMVVA